MEEESFFNEGKVSVSNSRFIVNGQTYAMNGVTSVKTYREGPARVGPTLLFLCGLGPLTGNVLAGSTFAAGSLVGACMMGLAVFWWIKQKPELSVMLNTASGEAQALTSKNASYIARVVEALNNSIVHRG